MSFHEFGAHHHKQHARYSKSRPGDDEEEGEILKKEEDQYLGTNYEWWHGGSKSCRDGFIEDMHVDYDSRKHRKVGDRIEHCSRDVWDKYGCSQERERGTKIEWQRAKHDNEDIRETERRGCRGMDWNRDMESKEKKDIRRREHEQLEHCDETTRYAERDVACEETVEPKISELEEEKNIDKVEESRKRRQAILEKYKYKKQELQNQVQPQPEVPEKEENASLPIDKVLGTLLLLLDIFPDVDSVDSIFSVGKSQVPNITSVSQGVEGVDAGASKGKGDGLQVKRSGHNDNWDNKTWTL
ncbi:hypothetical protein MKW98_027551 [Papaver atlanticum]|uniref:Uncharacterized protein n=1 Tax=Papaver atlanticum TaxID=357466 RepID=A0AAD4T473_9MAGN|nr:hypothetical protein MKW98_027551 [Papaver atlanticum]